MCLLPGSSRKLERDKRRFFLGDNCKLTDFRAFCHQAFLLCLRSRRRRRFRKFEDRK
jgi:hypothetical protein